MVALTTPDFVNKGVYDRRTIQVPCGCEGTVTVWYVVLNNYQDSDNDLVVCNDCDAVGRWADVEAI